MFSLRSLIAILNRPLAEVQVRVPVYAAAVELPMEPVAASQRELSL